MAQHRSTSKYFADDKDLADILLQGRFTLSALQEYARSRGLFVSSQLSKQEIVEVLRGLTCSWAQVSELVAKLDTQERAPHFLPRKKSGTFSDDDIVQAVEALREIHAQQNERIELKKSTDNNYTIEISYEETFYDRTRLLQKEPKLARIHIERSADKLSLRVEDNDKAKQVAQALTTSLTKEGQEPTKVIELSEIKQPRRRTAFFVELIKGIYAYDVADVSDVEVEHMMPTSNEGDADEDSAEAKAEAEKEKNALKSKLKSVAFSGSGLLYSREYQELIKSEFYLCKVVWTVDHQTSGGNRLALSAEFSEPDTGTGFRYAILGKWERNDEGELKKSRIRLKAEEAKKYEDAIETAAFDAYDFVTSPDFKLDQEEEKSND